MTPAVNPITLEVVRHAIFAITEEMRVILMRSARAPILKEAGDLSCVLTDAHGRLIAQGSKDIAIHLGVMAFTVKALLERLDSATLQPGDVYYTNAPDVGGNHLPDVKAIRPIFFDDQLVAFAVNLGHWADVGGTRAGSYYTQATEIYQEGLHITPLPVFRAGQVQPLLLELIMANVRNRAEREGDLYAQYACNEVATRRLQEVFTLHGRETVLQCFAHFLDESDRQMRAAIAALPDGTYYGEDYLDDDGINDKPVTIAGDRAVFDFRDSDPQTAGPLNCTYFMTCSAVYYAMKALVGPDIAPNDGCYRCLEVRAPLGSVTNPQPWAPLVGGNHETTQRIVDAIFQALAPVLPERVVAGGTTTSGVVIISGTDDAGRRFIFYETHGGGEGAQATRDGASGIRVHMANTMNTPIEAVEAEYPLRVEAYHLIPDSAGRGTYRGGLGLRRVYRILAPEAQVTTMTERNIVPPYGLFGGEPGHPYRATLNPEGEARRIRGKETVRVQRGDVIEVQGVGGGGYGPPAERDTALEAQDRLEGYVTFTLGADAAEEQDQNHGTQRDDHEDTEAIVKG
jgi:N-methylhydantoinase B